MNDTYRDQKFVFAKEHCKLDKRKYLFSHRMTNDLSKLSADIIEWPCGYDRTICLRYDVIKWHVR